MILDAKFGEMNQVLDCNFCVSANGNVSHILNKNNPHGVTIAQIGAAPAGYGLGESGAKAIPYGTDLDSLVITGWYCTHSTSQMYGLVNIPEAFTYGGGLPLIRVEALFNDWVVQTIYRIEEFAPHAVAVARRQCMSGVWYPWEYENPPMQVGPEYRTTERYMGKAVYTMCINLGTMPNATTVNYPISIPRKCDIRYSGMMQKSDGTGIAFPYKLGNTEQVDVCVANTAIYITSNVDHSAWNGYLTLWYIKD